MKKIAVLVLAIATLLVAAPANAEVRHDNPRQDLLKIINRERIDAGLNPVSFISGGCRSEFARKHTERMVAVDALFHSDSDEATELWLCMGEWPGVYGEIVGLVKPAWHYRGLVDAFMASDTHRGVILDSTRTKAAVGIVRHDGILWTTIQFYA